MNSHRALCGLVLLIVIAGCGGGGSNPNNENVSVSPATAMIPVNGQVPLQATVNGLCSGCIPLISWFISDNIGNDSSCVWSDTPPAGPCPEGTIQQPADGSLTATYHAPSTAGTFTVGVFDTVTFTVVKQGTSVITVTP
jgi:hypothetical protein